MDTAKSTSINPLYRERTTLHMFVTQYAADLKKDQYLEVEYTNLDKSHIQKMPFVVTDIDFLSTPGVMYVSLDPSYERNKDQTITNKETDSVEDFYWLNGGN
jgi:hypothetical protein